MSSLNNICCLNCPAGSHMTSPCTKHGEMMECKECDYGTFTEHSNDLKQCFKCAQCRSDQTIVRPCTETQDTECACKAGRFCAHDQACEVCKKCSRCEKDEVIVRNCTSTTNTECKKIQSTPPPSPDSQSSRPDGLKPGERNTEEGRNGNTRMPNFHNLVRARSSDTVEDECEALCESSCSSASNSQHNIAIQATSALLASPPQASPMNSLWQPNNRESFPELVPVNDESLQKCFDYFEEVDYDHQNRFFRHIGISDNVIKSKEHLHYVDRVHEVLNIWMEQKGREASLNDLLKALLNLNQRRTAEYIRLKVIEHGHYTECEKGLSEQFSDNM
ncbi:hematopoietic death receptor [Scomber japonicus]|uniref:hematopoietic death receptor n=1 Tax=Scomber japonicus TaxID=13676 RepID=UPI002305A5BF|nr:hematopoietic death receptor [Scomber japonicus]